MDEESEKVHHPDTLPPELRSVRRQFLGGISVFPAAVRLIRASRILRDLALLSVVFLVLWIGAVLYLIRYFENSRSITHTPATILLVSLSILTAFFMFPLVGPFSWAIQAQADRHIRFLFGEKGAQAGHRGWLLFEGLIGAGSFYLRIVIGGMIYLQVLSVSTLLLPDHAPRPLVWVTQQFLWMAVIALSTLYSLVHRYTGVAAFLRWHWAEVLGYVLGTWCFGLLGLAPWSIVLQSVAASLLQHRILFKKSVPDLARENPKPEVPPRPGRIPVHPRTEKLLRARWRKLGNIAWDAWLPGQGMRYRPFTLWTEGRAGDCYIQALLPIGENGMEDPNAARQFWLMETYQEVSFTQDLPRPGDKYAGPFPLDPSAK